MTEFQPQRASDPEVRELYALAARERLARDTNDWATLEALYWPDASVRVTWFDGSARDFIDASRADTKPGKINGFHEITPVRVDLRGDRALVESRGTIQLRPRVRGVECDLQSWCRFVSGFERRDGEWRMSFFDNIYVKDRVDATVPGSFIVVDAEELGTLRASYRWLAFTNIARGIPVSGDLPGDDRPDLIEQFWRNALDWLTTPHITSAPWRIQSEGAH